MTSTKTLSRILLIMAYGILTRHYSIGRNPIHYIDSSRTLPGPIHVVAALYIVNINNPLRYIDPDGRNPAAAVFDGGVELARELSAEGEWGVPLGGAVVVGAALAAGTIFIGYELYEAWRPGPPTSLEGTGCGSYCSAAEPATEPVLPETGTPEDLEKDPNKGHPLRERQLQF